MNQTLLIISGILGFLLLTCLVVVFFVSKKSQKIMQSLLKIMTKPESVRIKDATKVLQSILSDEITKISDNFEHMCNTLEQQINTALVLKKELGEQNNILITTADEATKKIVNMSQRLENTVDGLQNLVASDSWKEVQTTTDNFTDNVATLLNKISETTVSTTNHSAQIQDQINQCIANEQQVSECLQNTFNNTTDNMQKASEAAIETQQKLTDLSERVVSNFENIKNSSTNYNELMINNDKLLNDYLTKLTAFGKQYSKELKNQVNILTNTANLVGGNIRLAESSIDKHAKKLNESATLLSTTTETTKSAIDNVSTELTQLINRFNGEIKDFATEVVKELEDVAGVANSTLENTKIAATKFSESIKGMSTGVRATLIEMNEAHKQLSGQSEGLIKMTTDTTVQLQPLSELIEKYYQALPDLSQGSQDMADNLEKIVNKLTDKITLMKTTIAESLKNISSSSVQLEDLAGQSRQQMIDLMSDYAKAVDSMESLNKQMMVARATAPMEAIQQTNNVVVGHISTQDFIEQLDKIFGKLYEQAIDLTRSTGATIPDVVLNKYNNGDTKIFAKWLVKVLEAADKKQIKDLIKKDSVFKSQSNQFMRSFDKILSTARETDNPNKVITTITKSDLGRIYNVLKAHI